MRILMQFRSFADDQNEGPAGWWALTAGCWALPFRRSGSAAGGRPGTHQAVRYSGEVALGARALPSAEVSIADSARRCRSVIDPTVFVSDIGTWASSLRQRV